MAAFDAGGFVGGTAAIAGFRGDSFYVGSGASDVTPPVVTNWTPTSGTTIADTAPVGFDVTDNSGVFRRIIVVAEYPTLNVKEVVHDGTAFSANYSGTRTTIASGYRFSNVLRAGGWPTAPTITVYPFDLAGNESS